MAKGKGSSTRTPTSSHTNSKIAVAAIALLAAGGLAFAALPATYQNADGQKCGVNTYSLEKSCKGGALSATVTCMDGSKKQIGDGKSCVDSAKLWSLAASACKDKCVVSPDGSGSLVSCKENDGGVDPGQMGITKTVDDLGNPISSKEDYCESDLKLAEYSCNGEEINLQSIRCEAGFTCSNGSCVALGEPKLMVEVDEFGIGDQRMSANIHNFNFLGEWEMSAEDGDIEISDVYFINDVADLELPSRNSGDNAVIEYNLSAAGLSLDTAIPVNGQLHFELDEPFVIPSGVSVSLALNAEFADINSVETTQEPIKMALSGLELRDVASGVALSAEDILSPEGSRLDAGNRVLSPLSNGLIVLHKTLPYVSMERLDSDILANGISDIAKFSISASNNGDVSWNKITIDVDGTCQGAQSGEAIDCMSDFSIYDSNGNRMNGMVHANAFNQELGVHVSSTSISAGEREVYILSASLNGFAEGDSIRIRIENHSEGFRSANAPQSGGFNWSDNSGAYQSPFDDHWFNEHGLLGLPSRSSFLK